MAIVDPATRIFILFTVIAREKIEVVENVARGQPSLWKNLRMKWIPAASEMNKTIQDEPWGSNWEGIDCQSRQHH